ncbi:hypothetical protein FIU88_08170 [Halomonas sp. THAF12]|uniref:hypothetical protein n=1 Tax=Halomonas sp. THAF12 TaxID=2587849 RepID=UPI001268B1E6|nr:hypothetical protein [Halomonas sp. THAF12]QFT84949.1 hypothetical protein FIU88_08170 [Halomonas sp. THAF12]
MITISSKAGRRLAKAGANWERHHATMARGVYGYVPEPDSHSHVIMSPGEGLAKEASKEELEAAALEVARELIANRMHLQEGD